jgi:hypothetical protein
MVAVGTSERGLERGGGERFGREQNDEFLQRTTGILSEADLKNSRK